MDSQKIAGVVSLIKNIASISPKEWLPSVEGKNRKASQ